MITVTNSIYFFLESHTGYPHILHWKVYVLQQLISVYKQQRRKFNEQSISTPNLRVCTYNCTSFLHECVDTCTPSSVYHITNFGNMNQGRTQCNKCVVSHGVKLALTTTRGQSDRSIGHGVVGTQTVSIDMLFTSDLFSMMLVTLNHSYSKLIKIRFVLLCMHSWVTTLSFTLRTTYHFLSWWIEGGQANPANPSVSQSDFILPLPPSELQP